MVYILIIYTMLPSWFVGPVVPTYVSPDVPPIYIMGPSIKLPIEYTPDGHNRLEIQVDPPYVPFPPGGFTFPSSTPVPAVAPLATPPTAPRKTPARRFFSRSPHLL